jgi:hypothetical protein
MLSFKPKGGSTMTTEELLMPRYKVINIWPGMGNYGHYHGQVITMIKLNDGGIGWPTFKVTFYPAHFERYPHLFEPLPWWKDRKPEEMPEFIKHNEKVWKITKWSRDALGAPHPFICEKNKIEKLPSGASINWFFNSKTIQPATAAEYEAYLQTTNQLNNGQ